MEETSTQQPAATPAPTESPRHIGGSRNYKKIGLFAALALLVVAIPLTIFLSRQEQDIRQNASTVCTNEPADIVLVLDNSRSMKDGDLAKAKVAANNFIDTISKKQNMRVGIASFDKNGRLDQNITSDFAAAKAKINALQFPADPNRTGTCLECAIDGVNDNDVAGTFKRVSNVVNGKTNKRVVVILTDGMINHWQKADGTTEGSMQPDDQKKARDQALAAITRVSNTYGAQFWVVQYGAAQENSTYLKNIVNSAYGGNRTKGKYTAAASSNQWDAVYQSIAKDIMGGTITAHVYDDLNKNGVFDTNEPPLANVSVTLKETSGDTTKTTDVNGIAVFDGKCDGAYTLTVTPTTGYEPSPAGSNTVSFTLLNAESVQKDFGLKKNADAIVTAVTVTASPATSTTSCPATITFNGTITTTGPTTVTYQWLRSDSATSSAQTIVFTEAGSKPVSTTWELGTNGDPDFNPYTGWQQIQILTPNALVSEKANFSLTCKDSTTPPPTLTFTGNPTTISSGDTSTLTWTTTNVTSCTASTGWAGTKAPAGNQSTGPLATTTVYTLTCTGPGGSVTKDVTINVTGPSVTSAAGETTLTLSVLLHGIGASGDNVLLRPAPCVRNGSGSASGSAQASGSALPCYSNQNPRHPTKPITVTISNAQHQVVKTIDTTVTYDNAYGGFKGSANLGTNWVTGPYTLSYRIPMYLTDRPEGIVVITAGQSNDVDEVDLVSSDVNNDNRLSVLDYTSIIYCYTFPGNTPACPQQQADSVDVNDDGTVNEFDYNLFKRDYSVQYGLNQ